MCHGKIVCKYLISDIWLFNKIACLSIEELEFSNFLISLFFSISL